MKMRWILLSLILGGCPDGRPSGTPDSGPMTPVDAGVEKIIRFEAESIEGPALLFGDAVLESDRLEVDLVAHRLEQVYGLAFRIEYDPAVLELDTLERSPTFTHDELFEAKEARPGLITVAASAVGRAPGLSLDGAAVAEIAFTRRTDDQTEIRIVRPFGLDASGEELRFAAGKGAIVER